MTLAIHSLSNARNPNMIGKAAIALLTFHLARRGYDAVPTSDNSRAGDLWVDLGAGVISVEVKGSTKYSWTIRPSQVPAVSWFAFVAIGDGRCWLVPTEAVASLLPEHDRGQHVVASLAQIEALGGFPLHIGFRAISLGGEGGTVGSRRAPRVVTKTLSDRTVKTYRYPPYYRVGPVAY